MTLTAEEKQTCAAWAMWVTSAIIDACEDEGVCTLDDERFKELTVEILRDIAESNARRSPHGDGRRQRSEGEVMPKIYVFVNGRAAWGDVLPSAIAEDGTPLAGHCSSSVGWAKHDMGIGSDWKHDLYKKHYPDGYEVEWVDDVDGHPECLAAIAKANARAPEAKEERQASPSEREGESK